MQLLYGTTNPAKLAVIRRWLEGLPVTLLGLDTFASIPPAPAEEGETALSNARAKAQYYHQWSGLATLATDTALYIRELPPEKQPALHARRLYGNRRMTDAEMLRAYASLAAGHGGRVTAQYRNAVCLILADGTEHACDDDSIASNPFYLVDTPHPHVKEGFPIDSISIDIETGKYYFDMPETGGTDVLARGDGYRRFLMRALGLSTCA